MEKIRQMARRMGESFQKNFRSATLNFIFILVFINLFQRLFGAENSIVGVTFTVLMSASMVRDLTAAPVRHLLLQSAMLFLMAAAACFVGSAPPLLALPVNLGMTFIILYAFTYEYVDHLYFPYILSYLFMVFISPIQPRQLPKRLLGVLAGALSIILYQLVNGRKRVAQTARGVLTTMLERADGCIRCLLNGEGVPEEPEQMRDDLCEMSKIIYDRRKKALCISDASFAMVDVGRGLENLVLLLYELEGPITPERARLLGQASTLLGQYAAFVKGQVGEVPPICREGFGPRGDTEAERFYQCLLFIQNSLCQMARPEGKKSYQRTRLPLGTRLKAAAHVSQVRVIYALRVACLLSICTLIVQHFALPHGKWLLFTVASVSLPYADDVGKKAKKRMLATLIGGVCSVVLFSLIPSATGRTVVMMLSGYLSFYMVGYSATFSCSTIGALGGAVFIGAFGWQPVGYMALTRLGYVALGILIAFLGNVVLFPYDRAKATRQLFQKHMAAAELLGEVCKDPEADQQLYYNLVLQVQLQEKKLRQNAEVLGWKEAERLLQRLRQTVRLAHREAALAAKAY